MSDISKESILSRISSLRHQAAQANQEADAHEAKAAAKRQSAFTLEFTAKELKNLVEPKSPLGALSQVYLATAPIGTLQSDTKSISRYRKEGPTTAIIRVLASESRVEDAALRERLGIDYDTYRTLIKRMVAYGDVTKQDGWLEITPTGKKMWEASPLSLSCLD